MSIEDGPGPQVTRRLGYLLKHARMELEKAADEALAPFGVDGRDLGILLLLESHEPASQQQAAQRLGLDRTTMVARLDSLEARDLVSRHPDPKDRRRNVVGLTETGMVTLSRALRAGDEAERRFLAPLSREDAQLFREALHTIVVRPTRR